MAYKPLPERPCVRCGKAYRPTRPENKAHAPGRCQRAPEAVQAHVTETSTVPAPPRVVYIDRVGYRPDAKPKKTRRGAMHLIIPDVQTKKGVPRGHLRWVGQYIVDRKPDVVICIGDFADMPSLSSYDVGKKSFEGRRYRDDIEATHDAMSELMAPVWEYNEAQREAGLPEYKPRFILTLGNHEDRITRAIESQAILDGVISLDDLGYKAYGWEVHPFLEIVEVDGVLYSHYFTTGVMGRPVTSARALMTARCQSAIMGHVQHTDVYFHPKTQQCTMFVGTCYLHDEDYLGIQGNVCRRQIVVLHEVIDGEFDPMFVSLDYLKRRYSGS